MNQAHTQNGTHEQIITHSDRELDLDGLETLDELKVNTVSQFAAKIPKKPKP